MDRLEVVFQELAPLGGAVLLDTTLLDPPLRSAEEVVGEATAMCRQSGRLTWIVLGWLIRNAERLDASRLIEEAGTNGNLSVLGLLCDAAAERCPHPKFAAIVAACPKAPDREIFFHRVAASPLAARLTLENPIPLFLRWNYLSNEIRYL